MAMTEIAGALLSMYEKHKAYLEKQVKNEIFLDGKFNSLVPYKEEHKHKAEAYKLALDNIKSLFGEEQ